jgi:hypothetical protein
VDAVVQQRELKRSTPLTLAGRPLLAVIMPVYAPTAAHLVSSPARRIEELPRSVSCQIALMGNSMTCNVVVVIMRGPSLL